MADTETLRISDEDLDTEFHSASDPRAQGDDTDATDADGTDGDATDADDGDSADGDAADVTDGDAADADGQDA